MGTWGVALDMAKKNEENLSKLSRKSMYKKLSQHGSYTKNKVYTFKNASPELLESIRLKKARENRTLLVKKILLASVIAISLLTGAIIVL